jgi:hypothetical protein
MKTLGVALLLAGVVSLGGAPKGAAGPGGSQGEAGLTGPACPTQKRLLVRTAAGELIGPLVDTVDGGRMVLRLTVYVESLGRIIQYLDPASGRSEVVDVHFSTWDCSGTPRSLENRGGVLIAAGSRLFASTAPGKEDFTKRSFLDIDGKCHRYPQPNSSLPGARLQEVFDARYPYAAPLVIAYE